MELAPRFVFLYFHFSNSFARETFAPATYFDASRTARNFPREIFQPNMNAVRRVIAARMSALGPDSYNLGGGGNFLVQAGGKA